MIISYLYVGFLELQQGDKKVVSKDGVRRVETFQ